MCAARNDVKDGSEAESARKGLVYTKKVGWVDLGHARPDGARKLWNVIRNEIANHSSLNFLNWSISDDKSYVMECSEKMFINVSKKPIVGSGIEEDFRVKRNLSLKEKKAVAMAIYFDISRSFEAYQGVFPFPQTRDSSFSGEDLVSNIIGFYRAVEPGKKYIEMCEPVSLKEAYAIWDKFGPIGNYKNHQFRPLLFHLGTDKPILGTLPLFLRTIQPAKLGGLYSKYLTNYDNRAFLIKFGGPDD